MRIAYLINQYPRISHSFIRREIAALEASGQDVLRLSIRTCDAPLADEADRRELEKTQCILSMGALGLLNATVRMFAVRPGAFVRTLALAIRTGWRSERGTARHLAYFAEACVVFKMLREARIEHVHAHFGTNSTTVAMLCHALGGPRYSFTVHGPEEFDKPRFIALGEKISRCAFVVAVSEFGRSQLLRLTPFEQWRRVAVVHCGVDDSFLKAPPTPLPASPRLVCVGRLCEQKGQGVLIEAASRLRRRGVACSVELVGDGPMRSQLEALIDSLGLKEHVTITGWRSNAEVREHILDARLVVQPSFAEGLPVVIMEALALRRPVVSTYIAGIPELVEPGVCGWLTPAGSVDRLADALSDALACDNQTLEAYGEAGAARVAQCHNAAIEAGRLRTLIEESHGLGKAVNRKHSDAAPEAPCKEHHASAAGG